MQWCKLNLHKGVLHITVEDDGVGFNTKTKKKGLGLKNINSRIEFLKANLDVKSDAKGTTYTIEVDTTQNPLL